MAGKTAILSVRILGDGKQAKKELDKTSKNVEKFQDGLGKAGMASGAALTAGLVGAVNADGAKRKLAAGLGLTGADAQKAGQIAGGLYTSGLGESMADVTGAVDAVASSLADISTNGGADVERLSGKALTLAKTFETDVAGAASTAGILMKSGLAKDADEAFDLIAGGMQKVPSAMRDEILPVMDEYSKHFGALGIDGTTAMGMIVAASEDGAIGMDKMGDALKEFTIRGTDMSKSTSAAYETMGLSTEQMTNDLLAGGDTAEAAMGQIVHGLQSIKDPGEQAAAAVALFGTPLEDLGTNQIPGFLGMIDPMGDAFDSMEGSMQGLSDTMNTGPSVAFDQLKRTATGAFVDMGAAALPVLTPILELLTQFAPILAPIALGFAAVAAVTWLVTAATGAYNAALVIGRGAIVVASAAQWAWNAAMSANPIGIVILLIAGLVAGVIWAYENVGWFRDAMDTMGAVAVGVWETLVGWVQVVIGWLNDLLQPVGGIEGAMALVGSVGKSAFDGISGAIQGVIGWVKDAIGWVKDLFSFEMPGWMKSAGGAIGNFFGAGASAPATFAAPATMSIATMGSTTESTAVSPTSMAMYSYSAPASLSSFTSPTGSASTRKRAGDTYEFNIKIETGVGDPIAIGREVDQVLKRYKKHIGAA